jgi:ribosomal protein L9
MEALEKQRQATVAAEKKVDELQAEKARLERKLAERQATHKALTDKLDATNSNLAK